MNPLRMVKSLREDFERLGLVPPAEDTAPQRKRSVLSESVAPKESRRRPGVLKPQTEAASKDDPKQMKEKGYNYVVQFSNKDGSDFGEPMYFKSSSAVGPFMRQNPELKMKWTKKIDEMMGESKYHRDQIGDIKSSASGSKFKPSIQITHDGKKTNYMDIPVEALDDIVAAIEKYDVEEESSDESGDLQEARLKRIRTKKMSATKRAKNRISKRKRKAKIKRRMKLLKKTSKYKMRVKRLKNLRKKVKGSAGPRRQFRMVAGLEKHGTMLESVRELKFTSARTIHEELEAGLRSAMGLAETLMRKFAILDEMVDAPFDSSSLMIETSEVRLEAADVLDRMTTSTMSAADSAAVLKDMVNFLGGALKAYMDIAKDLPKSAYIGWDEAKEEKEVPEKAEGGHSYIGQDEPNKEKTKPEDSKVSTGNEIGKDKIKDEKWGVDSDSSKKQVAGEDQPKDEKQGIEADSGKDNKYIGKDDPKSEKTKPEQQAKM